MRARKGIKWGRIDRVKIAEHHPTNRVGMPKDIADIVYLMNARFVTGQDITVDGGVLKKQ
jgi:NAD(P)-dependent dehydrogenase (short-subunit alcohol dehydrogenase family)